MKSGTFLSLGPWLLLATLGNAHAIPSPPVSSAGNASALALSTLQRRAIDPANFDWIKRWAAIGDSFTAGIGAGAQLGTVFRDTNSWKCSRYDRAYPMVLNSAFGPAVTKFQYLACSGDRSEDIYKQVVNKLEDDMNFVTMTAGGNDLCLASMIKKCVFIPYDGEAACNAVIDKAEENVRTILKPNIKSILLALNSHMAKDSVVVVNGYAQFFNTDEEDVCTKKQDWGFSRIFIKHWFATGIKLDIARRKRFNSLVVAINDAIKEVIDEINEEGKMTYWLGFANWDSWAYKGVNGQFCDPASTGEYPDPKQPDLQFFKRDTTLYKEHTELKRRAELSGVEPTEKEVKEALKTETPLSLQEVYRSLLWSSANPLAAVRHRLSPRDTPAPPSCPGDSDFDPTLGLGLPDTFGKNFHPNEKGHKTIASFAMHRMIRLRAQVLGQDPSCQINDEFRCWAKEGSGGYANAAQMDINYQDFCNTLEAPDHEVGWTRSKTYAEGTPDEHTISLALTSQAASFNVDTCLESLRSVVHDCEGWGTDPLGWQGGGMWRRGEYTYRVDITRTNRPWPPPAEAYGYCKGKYKVVLSSFSMYGGGWSSWDYGQETLLKSIKSCIGSTPTKWKFWYYDEPDEDGNEWGASFNTPIWVNARCFDNDKVQKGAGGWTGGCLGSG